MSDADRIVRAIGNMAFDLTIEIRDLGGKIDQQSGTMLELVKLNAQMNAKLDAQTEVLQSQTEVLRELVRLNEGMLKVEEERLRRESEVWPK